MPPVLPTHLQVEIEEQLDLHREQYERRRKKPTRRKRRSAPKIPPYQEKYSVPDDVAQSHLNAEQIVQGDRQREVRRQSGLPACGTKAGYKLHEEAGETPCDDCAGAYYDFFQKGLEREASRKKRLKIVSTCAWRWGAKASWPRPARPHQCALEDDHEGLHACWCGKSHQIWIAPDGSMASHHEGEVQVFGDFPPSYY